MNSPTAVDVEAFDDLSFTPAFVFDRFELQKASLQFFHPGLDSFHFSADFDLNENSDGIDPGGEGVTVSFGTYTETRVTFLVVASTSTLCAARYSGTRAARNNWIALTSR